jgi:hypothetical protein
MPDTLVFVLFAVLVGGFCLLALWGIGKAQDDVHETADLDRRVSQLERRMSEIDFDGLVFPEGDDDA